MIRRTTSRARRLRGLIRSVSQEYHEARWAAMGKNSETSGDWPIEKKMCGDFR